MPKKLLWLVIWTIISSEACKGSAHEEALQGMHRVARDNCGIDGQQPHHVIGTNWTIAADVIGFDLIAADDPLRTNVYDKAIQYRYVGLDPEASYKLRLDYLSDNHSRSIRLKADGRVLDDNVALPFGKQVTRMVELPRETYADGNVLLEFNQDSGSGSDAVISVIELWSTAKTLVPFLHVALRVQEGRIEGQVAADGKVDLANTKISLAIEGTSWEKKVTSNKAGKFRAKLPKNLSKYSGRNLVVTAVKGKAEGNGKIMLKETLSVDASFSDEAQRPSSIPIVPGMNVGRSFFLADDGYQIGYNTSGGPYYEPAGPESCGIRNGPGSYNNYKISVGDTSGIFYVYAGDRPQFWLRPQHGGGGYAYPTLIPDLGVGGHFRLAVSSQGKTKWLNDFDSIDTVMPAGEVTWTCADEELNVEIEMKVNAFVRTYGCAATAKVLSGEDVTLNWAYGWSDQIELKDNYAMVTHPDFKYTRVYVGTESGSATLAKEGKQVRLALDVTAGDESRLVCVWGYTDYNRQEVTNALNRLRYKPFVDQAWVEQMKKKWFANWVGKCLEPESKFIQARDSVDEHLADAEEFWSRHRRRVRIKTPEPRLDTVVNHIAASLFLQFEYPSFLHGLDWVKIGKINCGYYGHEQAGLHEEVATSLEFLTGNQCLKGRMRYWSPVFMISGWSEEQDFYFVDHVWHHYRWTGDREYVKKMWPSVRKAMEHGLTACDPDGDGIMTAYYEQWSQDAHCRGGRSVLFTSLARSALRGAVEMARIAGDYDTETGYQGMANEDTPEARLRKLLDRIEANRDEPFWCRDIGAWSSAENNGDIRPHPEPMEQNYCIWRGWGADEPMKQYMAMRYVRDNLHINPYSGVTVELVSDYWPIVWSHHYSLNGDSSMSVLCAAKTGDIDNFWNSYRSIYESAYTNHEPTITWTLRNHGLGASIGQGLEMQPQFIQAMISGFFGAEPYFGENRLELIPAFPSDWDHAEIATTNFAYEYKKDDTTVSMHVTTPVDRIVKAKLPVKARVRAVTLNGRPVDYTIETAVNTSRVVIETRPGREFDFSVKTTEPAIVTGDVKVFIGEKSEFQVAGADVVNIHDPQEKMGNTEINFTGDTALLVPAAVGKYTVFLELKAGDARWLHALDLEGYKRWTLAEEFITAFNPGGPSVASPRVSEKDKTLTLKLENNSPVAIVEKALVTVAGKKFKKQVSLPANASENLTLSLDKVWPKLSPGSIPIEVRLAGDTQTRTAVNWQLGQDKALTFPSRLKALNLDSYYNIDISHLYSLDFHWRIDYTGCGIGIDWRTKMPHVDDWGYVLMSPPTAVYAYLNLWEACSTDWKAWQVPDFDNTLGDSDIRIGFNTGAKPVKPGTNGNILALLNSASSESLPSAVTVKLKKPLKLEKIYLLTANITKTLKSYYPGAEVVIHYTDGPAQHELLIPPYTMGNILYPVSPLMYHIGFGGDLSMAIGNPSNTGLSVQDLVLDPKRRVDRIELRCVTSETIFGVMGLTLLEAI